MKVILCIPTFNSGKKLIPLLKGLENQTLQVEPWVIDSSSKDDTISILTENKINFRIIPQSDFNHGKTRNLFLDLTKADFYIYLTDDAIPAHPEAFERLVKVLLDDARVGVAYGRQLPHRDANPFAAHARLFNYPENSVRKTIGDKMGIKTPFSSNSFAAYRAEALREVGGFPDHTILSEDVYVAARLLKKGWAVYYVADAVVFHSHNYSVIQEFKRYFDIGVFYGSEKWILESFGTAQNEGNKFLKSQMHYLNKKGYRRYFPEWFFRNLMKWVGYKLGMKQKYIPLFLKKKLGMHKNYWDSISLKANRQC